MLKRLLVTGLAGTLLAGAFLYPAGARLDEWILADRPYEHPAAQDLPQSRYVVKEGDSLWKIAADHRVDMDTLLELNTIANPDFLRPGQLLTVPGTRLPHLVQEGENLTAIAAMYQVTVADLVRENGLDDPDRLFPGQRLSVPVRGHGGPAAPAVGWRSLLMPAAGPVSDVFGTRADGQPHYGIDFAADHGAPIRAAEAGQVVFAGPAGTFGLLVILDHGDGLTTYYAHCSEIAVACGDRVNAGEIIARVGDTGRSFGPHLHFEVRWNGEPYDPMLYLTGVGHET
ncbi:MAG: M23 family metallopeptidase [Bacillota bacterium]|jgi:murein DD-endopeptidase MepM/ murein hydrolase activator NlpD